MKLISLSLKYFRQHRETTIQFNDGLTGIIGTNGAGKTTVVEAIAFALYGSRALRGRVDEVTTKNAPRSATAEVSLLFEHDGKNFRIERTLTEAKIFVGGALQPISEGSREVSQRIRLLLGMSHEEFSATYFTEQKGLEFLSGKRGAAERERFIVRMMGFDRLEKLQDLLRTDRRDKRNEISGWEAGLGSREQITQRITTETKKLEEVKKQHNEAEQAVKQAEAAAERLCEEFKKLDQVRQQLQEHQRERDQFLLIVTERKRLQSNFESEIKNTKIRAAKLLDSENVTTKQLKKVYDASTADLAAQERIYQELRNQADVMQQSWQKDQSSAVATIDQLEQQLVECRKKKATYKKLDDESDCPLCGQTLGETFGKVHQELSHSIDELEQKKEKHVRELERLRKEPKQLQMLRKELIDQEKKLGNCRQLARDLEGLEPEVATLNKKENDLLQLQDEIEQVQSKIQNLQAKLAESGFSEDTYRNLKGRYESSERLVEVARLKRVQIEGALRTCEALCKRTQDELRQYDQKEQELTEAKKRLLVLEESDLVLTEFRKHLNASLRPQLAELAGEFLAELTDSRYSAIELGEDFTPTVLEDGETKGVISGGEEDILNLCLRLALSQLLAERAGHTISLLILDEVFGSLDENRRNNVIDLLEKLSHRFEQVLIITHLDDIKEGVRHLITVEYDDSTGEIAVIGSEEYSGELVSNL